MQRLIKIEDQLGTIDGATGMFGTATTVPLLNVVWQSCHLLYHFWTT